MKQVDDDPYFKRDGDDVHVEVPVTVRHSLTAYVCTYVCIAGLGVCGEIMGGLKE